MRRRQLHNGARVRAEVFALTPDRLRWEAENFPLDLFVFLRRVRRLFSFLGVASRQTELLACEM